MEFVKGRVLDIGCGAGRHSRYLQERGFDVLRIDILPLAIEVCKLRGLKKAEVMSIEEVNFKPNSWHNHYDGKQLWLVRQLQKSSKTAKKIS